MAAISHSTSGIIDRIAPTRRPNDRVVMRQNWSSLLFLHWTIPAEQLRPHIPAELEIDTFEGRAYVGLVPFTMTGVRPIWSPSIPPLSDFHETNVRTYVHHKGANPGVWFFSLDAANAIAVRIARSVWRLPYYYARMAMEVTPVRLPARERSTTGNGHERASVTVAYRTERLWPAPIPASCATQYTVDGDVQPAEPDTLEHFLAERYLLYTKDRNRLYRAQVHHTPYPLQTATVHSLEENMLLANALRRGDEAPLAHYASGVSVDIFPLRTVER